MGALFFPHSYRASWYYQTFIYSPTDAPVSCLKNNIKIYIKIYIKTAPTCFGAVSHTIIRERINSCLLKLQMLKQSIKIHRCVVNAMVVWSLILVGPVGVCMLHCSAVVSCRTVQHIYTSKDLIYRMIPNVVPTTVEEVSRETLQWQYTFPGFWKKEYLMY
jgi:hypothetical protein